MRRIAAAPRSSRPIQPLERCRMIVDLETRAWSSTEQFGASLGGRMRRLNRDRPLPLDASPARLHTETECVAVACVLGHLDDRENAAVPAAFVADIVRRWPGRFVGVAGIDPLHGDPVSQIEQARGLGLHGITASPSQQGFHPTHSAAMRAYEAAERAGMPLWVSRPGPLGPESRLEFDQPLAWDEVARSFPSLPIVISGIGDPWIPETLQLLVKHERVFASLAGLVGRSWTLFGALQQAEELGVLDRLLFASGFPYVTPAQAIENLYSVNALSHGTQLPSIPRAKLKAIVERESLPLLGIEFDVAGPGLHAGGSVDLETPSRIADLSR